MKSLGAIEIAVKPERRSKRNKKLNYKFQALKKFKEKIQIERR